VAAKRLCLRVGGPPLAFARPLRLLEGSGAGEERPLLRGGASRRPTRRSGVGDNCFIGEGRGGRGGGGTLVSTWVSGRASECACVCVCLGGGGGGGG
jgi:hypothetical protein